MASLYSDVYDFFLLKITDFKFITLTQVDLEGELERYMRIAITKFRISKVNLLDRDEVGKKFNNTLTDAELNVLSTLMLIEYLKPKVLNSKLMKQSMTGGDFKIYSQANHLQQMVELYKFLQKEVSNVLSSYSYDYGDVNQLKNKNEDLHTGRVIKPYYDWWFFYYDRI